MEYGTAGPGDIVMNHHDGDIALCKCFEKLLDPLFVALDDLSETLSILAPGQQEHFPTENGNHAGK